MESVRRETTSLNNHGNGGEAIETVLLRFRR
nr:MAG TPA: hypothetical protein [Caudoviricetes sp.]